jgi:hypothetical protein
MHLISRESLRDGESSLKYQFKSLYLVGVKPVARSFFAEANNQRPASFFEALFGLIYRGCQPLAPKHKFQFKNKLYSVDTTIVRLCLKLFSWASFRRTKAGIKLHTLLNHDGYLPAFVAITPAGDHEVKKARTLNLPKGFIVMEDLSFADHARYGQLTTQRIFVVTRQKHNTVYEVLKCRKVKKTQGSLSDQTIRLTGAKAQEYSFPLRDIAYRDAASGKCYVFLTNHFKLTANTISDIYKGKLANQDLLPLHQAEPENEGLCWQLGECRLDANLRVADCLSPAVLCQVTVLLERYFAKPQAYITTQSLSNMQRQGAL